jgi:hypothetical protein
MSNVLVLVVGMALGQQCDLCEKVVPNPYDVPAVQSTQPRHYGGDSIRCRRVVIIRRPVRTFLQRRQPVRRVLRFVFRGRRCR